MSVPKKSFLEAKRYQGGIERYLYDFVMQGGEFSQVQADWNVTDTSKIECILHRPIIIDEIKDDTSDTSLPSTKAIKSYSQKKLVNKVNIAGLKIDGVEKNLLDGGEIEITTGGESGTGDYPDLTNKPKINNNELIGNKTSADLGLANEAHPHRITDVTLLETTLDNKQSKLIDEGANQNIKTVDGQSLLGKGNIETGTPLTKADYALTADDVTLDPNEYDEGFFWLTGLGTHMPHAKILKIVDGTKTWVEYHTPYARQNFPTITSCEDGELFIQTLDDYITSDDHVFKVVIHDDEFREWVELSNGGLDYLNLLNKPSVNGKTLEGNKTLEDLGVQAQLVSGVNIQKLKVNDSTYDLNKEGTIEIITGGGTGTGDYTKLNNLPRINNVLLKKDDNSVDFTFTDIGIPVPAPTGKVILSRSTPFTKMVKKDTLWIDVALLAMDAEGSFTKYLDEKEEGGAIKKQWLPYNVQQIIVDTLPSPYDEEYTDKCLCVVRVPNHAACSWEVYQLNKDKPEWVRLEATYGYTQLQDKPNINGVRVAGNKELEDYGIQEKLVDVATEDWDKNTAQFIIDGQKQSIFQSGDIEINTLKPANYIISRETQAPEDYNEGFYWITYEAGTGWISYILTVEESAKSWTRIRDPIVTNMIPPIDDVVDGQLLVLSADSKIESDDDVYKAVKNETVQKWVKLNAGHTYFSLPDKPSIIVDKGTENEKKHILEGEMEAHYGLGLASVNELNSVSETLKKGYIEPLSNRVATTFDETSTDTSPSCKAIADYIKSLLNGLDGSEEEF